jgi:hypothetical protein
MSHLSPKAQLKALYFLVLKYYAIENQDVF